VGLLATFIVGSACRCGRWSSLPDKSEHSLGVARMDALIVLTNVTVCQVN
jgi:hypothetical protein